MSHAPQPMFTAALLSNATAAIAMLAFIMFCAFLIEAVWP